MIRLTAALSLTLATPAAAQRTPEQAHRDATGPSTMCGITGRDAADLIRIVRQTPRFHEQAVGSPRFELFATSDSMTQWLFTKVGEAAHPAVSCRHVFADSEGGFSQTRDLRCDSSREACDRLFVELRDLDDKVREALGGN